MSLYFLNEVVTQEWKNKYIKVYIPLSGAWAGASEPLEAVVSGYFPLTFCPLTSYLKDIERSIQSLYWLTPRAEVFGSQVLMQTPNTNYTANDYQQLFTNFANYPLGWTKYMPTSSINAGYSYPQVPTYCFYGSNIETPLTYVYSSDVASSNPSVINGLGDGTVNEISLEVCLNWNASTNSSGFQSRAFPGVEHGEEWWCATGRLQNSGSAIRLSRLCHYCRKDFHSVSGCNCLHVSDCGVIDVFV